MSKKQLSTRMHDIFFEGKACEQVNLEVHPIKLQMKHPKIMMSICLHIYVIKHISGVILKKV